MSKIRYFNNKFSKIAKSWGLSASSAPLTSILVTWSYGICPNCGFSNGLWRNRTLMNQYWRHFSTSSISRHQKRHQTNGKTFFYFG